MQRLAQGDASVGIFGLFNRCMASDNVMEGAPMWLVCVHVAMTANEFTMRTIPRSGDDRGNIGFVIADSASYVSTHSGDFDWVLRDITGRSAEVTTLDMTIA
jgi:hypothetical protein